MPRRASRRILALLGLVWVIGGCGTGGASPSTASTDAPEVATVAAPPPFQASALHMLNQGEPLRLGITHEDALLVYPRPKTGFDVNDLPPNFKAPFRAQGWEAGRTGFGTISYNTRVVLAMSQVEQGQLTDYDKVIETYESDLIGMAPVDITNGSIRYRFYEANGERLMILAVPSLDKTVNITVALGLAEIMSAIGADPTSAQKAVAASSKIDEVNPSK